MGVHCRGKDILFLGLFLYILRPRHDKGFPLIKEGEKKRKQVYWVYSHARFFRLIPPGEKRLGNKIWWKPTTKRLALNLLFSL